MTIDKMIELYERGLYSPINCYLEVMTHIKGGADVTEVLRNVPAELLDTLKRLADRHHQVCPSGDEEWLITRQICAWSP